jgi:hypothetical protein
VHGDAGGVGAIRRAKPQADARKNPIAFRVLTHPPHGAADDRDRITEGRLLLMVPGRPLDEGRAARLVRVRNQGDKGKQADLRSECAPARWRSAVSWQANARCDVPSYLRAL